MRPAIGAWLRFAPLLVALLALPTTRSAADFVYTDTLSELYDEAEIVATLHIDSVAPQFVTGRRCGTRYDGHLLRVFKGTRPHRLPAVVQFGDRGDDLLSPGKEYFVTLQRIADPETLYDKIHRDTRWSKLADLRHLPEGLSREEAVAFLGCNGLNAALHFDIAWALADRSVVVTAPLPGEWPVSIPKQPDPSVPEQWIVSKPELFAYFDSLRH